eukprot:2918066-Amphidinium_carterae.1
MCLVIQRGPRSFGCPIGICTVSSKPTDTQVNLSKADTDMNRIFALDWYCHIGSSQHACHILAAE